MRKNTTHAVAAAAMFPIFLAVLFAVTFLTSCEPEKQTAQSPPLPSSVSITVAGGAASSFTLKVGERVQLSADITPSNAGNKNVTWISSEPTIVSVSADGLAEALLDGRAVITVTTEAGSVTADIAFTVIAAAAPTVAVSGVSITNKNGAAVVFNNKIWMIGDGNGSSEIWSSSDGSSWNKESSPSFLSSRTHHTALVFQNKLWVMGGSPNGNDVWVSNDGKTWNEVSGSAAQRFSARVGLRSVVFNNKMWIIGGTTNGNYFSDVWSSDDGVSWTQETPNAGFAGRIGHSVVALNGKIWVIGGNQFLSTRYKDVWSSSDGKNWTKEPDAPFSERDYHGGVVLNGSIWIIGGYGDRVLNDVWRYGQ